jgi:AbrB family looped-hinge helix DNA binding protein
MSPSCFTRGLLGAVVVLVVFGRNGGGLDLRRTAGGPQVCEWYLALMSGTYNVVMGDRGRLVVPVELRERLHLESGSPLLLLDTDDGVVLTTRDQAKTLLRRQLAGQELVAQLLRERRTAAADEDR